MNRLFFLLCVAATTSTVGIASANSPPTIVAIHSRADSTTAEIRMFFRSNDSCRLWFELSTHSDLSGAKRVHEGWVDITGNDQYVARLTELTPNTVYYYRAHLEFYRNQSRSEVHSSIESFHTTHDH
jgi:phosphodiesterase/alkaline phosphatase D-like protein